MPQRTETLNAPQKPRRPGERLHQVVERCQILAGLAIQKPFPGLIAEIRTLLAGAPESLETRERLLIRVILANVLGRVARLGRVEEERPVAAAFIRLMTTSSNGAWRDDAEEFIQALEKAAYLSARPSLDLRLGLAMVFLDQHYRDRKITLAAAAARTGLSPGHLSRLLRQGTGTTFTDHVHERRLQAAQQLLEETGLTVKEIAVTVGYANSSVLDRYFKRKIGVTPTAHRRTYRVH